ncbi:THUMP domain-containing protein 1 homolog [Zophobas morio]|uniref:THUMP domain-containing protein 1 homolog n=1 Tax=Zophobas morio TaxID=2755281 RepID=UPI003083CD9A
MSKADSKYKSKKFFMKQGGNRKVALDLNLKGFLCSCNNREKDCIREAYNLLNEYADKLYPAASRVEETEEVQDEDISESLTKEISDLKEESTPNKKRFQAIESGARNLLFIRTTVPNPAELAEAIVKDVHENGSQKTKFLLRLVPVETTCRASVADIGNAFVQLAEKHFQDSAQTFNIMFNHRNNNVVSRDDVIKLIAEKISAIRPDHKVDLKAAKLSVIVEVIKGFAFLSIVPDYLKYKKYNLLAICNQEETTDS